MDISFGFIISALLTNVSFLLPFCIATAYSQTLDPVGPLRTMGSAVSGMGSADGAFEKDRISKVAGDPTRREFTYFMLGGARFIYASAARLALIKVSG